MSTTIDTRTAQYVKIYHYLRDKLKIVIIVTDEDDAAVDLSAKTLVCSIRESEGGSAVETISGENVTISGGNNNVVTIEKALTSLTDRTYHIDLDNTTDNETIFDGKLIASYQGR